MFDIIPSAQSRTQSTGFSDLVADQEQQIIELERLQHENPKEPILAELLGICSHRLSLLQQLDRNDHQLRSRTT